MAAKSLKLPSITSLVHIFQLLYDTESFVKSEFYQHIHNASIY